MNKTIAEGVVLAQEISNEIDKDWCEDVDVAVCPPFVDLKPVKTVFEFDHQKIGVGAQNVYFEDKGAFTGEISVDMIAGAGCEYCIVGHSERRQIFGETNEDINRKIKALTADAYERLTPIVCVGESLAVREDGDYLEYISAQVRAAFAGIDEEVAKSCVVAYEPIWAIGTGRTATPEQAQEVCAKIRATLSEFYSSDAAEKIRVLYGGSMNEGNAALLLAEPDIDGGLIGGASLKALSFCEIIKQAAASVR
jgi:triosephosphate isomerase